MLRHRPSGSRNQRGETLIEICIALVIISAVTGSFFAAFSTASTASTSHRNMVTADATLRDYAEATKAAVRSSCASLPGTYSVSYSPPAGFSVNPLTSQPCPPASGSLTAQVVKVSLVVTMPGSHTKSLDIGVRSP